MAFCCGFHRLEGVSASHMKGAAIPRFLCNVVGGRHTKEGHWRTEIVRLHGGYLPIWSIKMRKRDFAALLIILAVYYTLKGVGGLIERGRGVYESTYEKK